MAKAIQICLLTVAIAALTGQRAVQATGRQTAEAPENQLRPATDTPPTSHKLWYRQPARKWEEALPLADLYF